MITSQRELIQRNHSYPVKSADSGSRRTIRTRGSSCLRASPVCPCVGRSRRLHLSPGSGGERDHLALFPSPVVT